MERIIGIRVNNFIGDYIDGRFVTKEVRIETDKGTIFILSGKKAANLNIGDKIKVQIDAV